MNKAKYVLIGVLSLAALLVVLKLTLFAPKPDDQRLIAQALDDSITAAKEGRPSVVLDRLSRQFQINEQSPGSRWDIAKFVRESKPDVEVMNRTATVSGDTARILSPVRVRVSYLNQNFDFEAENVTLVFEREDDREYFIFPTREWKLKDVIVPQNAVPAGMSGDFGGI